MLTPNRRITAVLLLALAAAGSVSAARQARLIGKIVDPQGKPIEGVTVTATSKDIAELREVTRTDAKGLFIVDFEQIGVVYNYRFEKPGYLTAQVNQTWTLRGTERHTFTMQPGAAPAADLPPPVSTSNPAITAFNEGVRAFEARSYAEAGAKLEAAVRHDPKLGRAWAMLSQAHVARKRYQEAAEAAEKAISLGMRNDAVLLARWEAYRNLGDEARAKQAREELDNAGRLQEEARRIHNDGVALAKLGNHAEALAKFQEAVEIDPSFLKAWLAAAVAGLEAGRADEAAAAAQKAQELDPGNAEAIRLQYNAALKTENESKIAEALVALGAIEPTVARDNLFKLGRRAFDRDEVSQAKERLGRVLELDAQHAEAHYYLGLLYVKEGAKKEARAHLTKFLDLAPSHPDADTAKGLLAFVRN